MKKKIFLVSAFILFGLMSLLSGCYVEPNFDVVPNIKFADLRKEVILDAFDGTKKDSVIVSIGFQDGDGDLGYDDKNPVDAKAKKDAAAKGDFAFVVKLFRQRRGKFTEVNYVPSLSGFFLALNTDNKKGPIEGTIDYSMDFPHAFSFKKDSVKFQVTIKDRAGHTSNTVESKVIILNE
jgi:hypothetical protein